MKLSTEEYDLETQKLVEAEQQRLEEERRKLREVAYMTTDEHLALLDTVIQGHFGARYIKIWYNLPDVSMRAVAEILRERGWRVDEMSDGIAISNFGNLDGSLKCAYDEYPYRKFQRKNERQTIIDFWVGDGYVEEIVELLIAFKDCIRVQLWDLLIPKDRICKHPASPF